jgi:hypothetical protein
MGMRTTYIYAPTSRKKISKKTKNTGVRNTYIWVRRSHIYTHQPHEKIFFSKTKYRYKEHICMGKRATYIYAPASRKTSTDIV